VDLAPRRLNLSYVLHEPSTSAVVRAAAERSNAEARRLRRATAALAALSDAALRQRIVVLATTQPDALSQGTAPPAIASIHLGPWWLLPRVLGLIASDGTPRPVHLIDQPAAAATRIVPFFRAPARLAVPDASAPDYPAWFAALVLRPGGDTLLLQLDTVPGSEASPTERDAALVGAAERAIRAHVEQWSCPGPLWDASAERSLPEFAPG